MPISEVRSLRVTTMFDNPYSPRRTRQARIRIDAPNTSNSTVLMNLSVLSCLLRIAAISAMASPLYAGIVEMPDVEQAPPVYGRSVFENYNIPSTTNRGLDPQPGPRL